MSASHEKVDIDKLVDYLYRSAKVQCSHCRSFGAGRKPCEKCDRMLCEQCRLPMYDKSTRHECRALLLPVVVNEPTEVKS